MNTSLQLRSNWFARSVGWALRVTRIATVGSPRPEDVRVGSDYAPGMPTHPGYDANTAMSAYPANGWLAACIEAIAWDSAGLPLQALQGKDSVNHPALGMFPVLLRAQVITDLVLAGNVYLLVLVGSRGEPVGLQRLHPAKVQKVFEPTGEIAAYHVDVGGRFVDYSPNAIVHIRGISWEADARGEYGQGAARPLDADIRADRALAESSRRSASSARPVATFSPASDKTTWSTSQVRDMTAVVKRMLDDHDGGAAVLAGHGVLTPLGWSPREMEGVAQRTWTRDLILAVLGVPPSRVGLPTANYATQHEQMATYWQTLISRLALLEEAYTAIARQFRGPMVTISHDLSLVQPLQPNQTEALGRITAHIGNGMDPLRAYHLEGYSEVGPEFFAKPEPDADETPPKRINDALRELSAARAILSDPDSSRAATADALCSLEASHAALAAA